MAGVFCIVLCVLVISTNLLGLGNWSKYQRYKAGAGGFEPPNDGFKVRCSTLKLSLNGWAIHLGDFRQAKRDLTATKSM